MVGLKRWTGQFPTLPMQPRSRSDGKARARALEVSNTAIQFLSIAYRPPPLIDMTPDGRVRPPARLPLPTRLLAGAVVIAVLSGLVAMAAIAISVALSLIPIAVGAAIVAWAMLKYRAWQRRRGGRDLMRR